MRSKKGVGLLASW